jgi:undecaprenyl-diphosphatase
MGKALGLASYLALGAVCYPLYVVLFLLRPEGNALIAQVAMADIAGLVVLVGLRYATRRQRPRKRRNHRYLTPWNRYSFPSGHAVRAFAVSATLTLSGPAWCVLAVPIACVIALSRITLSRHYPSDVLAGMGIGILAGLAGTIPTLVHAPEI